VLKEEGARLTIVNRSSDRGQALAAALGCPFIQPENVDHFESDIVVNATPVGMWPDCNESIVPISCLRPETVVMDMVYNPPYTQLLRDAERNGCVTVSGLHMFIHQGAEQFRLWTGKEPPIEVMTRAVDEALRPSE
jgi:shikimate 5-dehydrogenase